MDQQEMASGAATGNMGIQGGRKGRDAEAVRDFAAVTMPGPLAAPEGLAVSRLRELSHLGRSRGWENLWLRFPEHKPAPCNYAPTKVTHSREGVMP